VPNLHLHSDYSREDVHDIFDPSKKFTPQAGTWGLQGIVEIPDRAGDFVFFVTYGKREGAHEFDEGISEEGVLRWQSQPKQNLANHQIQRLIAHNEDTNSIYLFLRTSDKREGTPRPYTYLGRLKYITHDREREQPVYFDWQLLDWPIPDSKQDQIGLKLEGIKDVEPSDTSELQEKVATLGLIDGDAPQQSARVGSTTPSFKGRVRGDYAQRDAANRKLGLAGEEAVLKHERQRLMDAGIPNLAEDVRHIAVEEGDGAGYDILSYRNDGTPIYIEVKTTRNSIASDFFMSANEVAFSETHADQYELHRLYEFVPKTLSGHRYKIHGDIGKTFEISPIQYRIRDLSRTGD